MACGGCRKNKSVNKYGQVVIRKGKVTGKILSQRQSTCAKCVHVTNTNTVKLTIKSTCKIENRMLINALRDPIYKCPIGKFGQIKPK